MYDKISSFYLIAGCQLFLFLMFLDVLVTPTSPRHAGIHHVQVATGAQLIDDAAAAVEVADDVAHVLFGGDHLHLFWKKTVRAPKLSMINCSLYCLFLFLNKLYQFLILLHNPKLPKQTALSPFGLHNGLHHNGLGLPSAFLEGRPRRDFEGDGRGVHGVEAAVLQGALDVHHGETHADAVQQLTWIWVGKVRSRSNLSCFGEVELGLTSNEFRD